MRITLLAHTALAFDGLAYLENRHYDVDNSSSGPVTDDADALAEVAGRSCYQSWSRPNPKTATSEGYLKHILEVGHESVLEHASATFYIEGVSRSLTHELIRHRHLSYSELSQRFVNIEGAEIVEPPIVTEQKFGDDGTWTDVGEAFEDAASGRALDFRGAYKRLVEALMEEGATRKQAREAARAVMPNMVETKIVVTGNHRAWREVLMKRGSIHADAEIRNLALELYRQLSDIAPNTYQDITIGHEGGHDVLVKE